MKKVQKENSALKKRVESRSNLLKGFNENMPDKSEKGGKAHEENLGGLLKSSFGAQ